VLLLGRLHRPYVVFVGRIVSSAFSFNTIDHARSVLGDLVDEIMRGKASYRTLRVCSRDRKCRGSLPFLEDGTTVDGKGTLVRFVYWDGPPDDGHDLVISHYTFKGDSYSWSELK
jgi:hypothetical protein